MRDNYDTLTLKLQDSLDRFEKYTEHPTELPFVAKFCSTVIIENRLALSFDSAPNDRKN